MNENEKLYRRYKGPRQNKTNLKLHFDNSQTIFDKLLSKQRGHTANKTLISLKKYIQTAQINFGMK